MPDLYIITGSNGAGKSSAGSDHMPSHLRETIFDGDKLLMTKSREYWTNGIKSSKECKKLAAEFVDKAFDDLVVSALKIKADFAYEGHFTNDASWRIPKQFKQNGYAIHLIFFGLTDIELSETRVVARAREGGHHVDPLTLRNNFYGNLEKLDKYYSIFDTVRIFDTSSYEHLCIAILEKGTCIAAIANDELPQWFTENLPTITKVIVEPAR